MKRFLIKIFPSMTLVLVLLGCETYKDQEIKHTATFPVSGEWWVTYQEETSPGVFEDLNGGYTKLLTYNTASDTPDSIWVDDDENFWEFKCKAALNIQNRTFESEGSDNEISDSIVKITNGKVIVDGGLSTSRVVTDSIYFEVSFDDDTAPFGTNYIVSGVRRTGFLEDEH